MIVDKVFSVWDMLGTDDGFDRIWVDKPYRSPAMGMRPWDHGLGPNGMTKLQHVVLNSVKPGGRVWIFGHKYPITQTQRHGRPIGSD